MSKDLIKGFLLAHNAPKEVMDALALLGESITYSAVPVDTVSNLPTWEQFTDGLGSNYVRVMNCLKNEGIDSVEKLLEVREQYLMRVPNFGRKSLNDIKQSLAQFNLKLAA